MLRDHDLFSVVVPVRWTAYELPKFLGVALPVFFSYLRVFYKDETDHEKHFFRKISRAEFFILVSDTFLPTGKIAAVHFLFCAILKSILNRMMYYCGFHGNSLSLGSFSKS